METNAVENLKTVDKSPAGFAARLENLAGQLCTGLSLEAEGSLKDRIMQEVQHLRGMVPGEEAPGAAVHVPHPDATAARLTDQLDRLESFNFGQLAAELRESINRIEEHSVRLSLFTKPADPTPAAEANQAPAAGV